MSVAVDSLKLAVLMVNSANINGVFRQELKELGVPVQVSKTADECLQHLQDRHDAILVIEWSEDPIEPLRVLQALQTPLRSTTLPIFLISRSSQDDLTHVAIEFGVAQVHVGELSRVDIRKYLERIIDHAVVPQGVRTRLRSIVRARECGEWNTAEELLRDLYHENPEDQRVVCELAENHLYRGKVDEAMQLLAPLASEAQAHVRVLHLYGRTLMKMGSFEKAATYLQRARAFNPFNVKRLVELGESLLRLERGGEARSAFEDALSLDPRNSLAAAGKGKALLMLGEVNEALLYLKGVTSPLEIAAIFNSAGVLAMRDGRHEDGMRLYELAAKAIMNKDDFNLARLGYNMALGYWRMRRLVPAAYFFSLAFALDPDFRKAEARAKALSARVGKMPELRLEANRSGAFLREFDETQEFAQGNDADRVELDVEETIKI